jgi:hypothetical protein
LRFKWNGMECIINAESIYHASIFILQASAPYLAVN